MGGLLSSPITTKETEDGKGKAGQFEFGVSAMQGWRKAMEDSHLALPDFDPQNKFGLFGVFDGHGGAAVAKLAAEKLPEILRALPSYKKGAYQEALHEAFLKVDAYLDSKEGRRKVQELVAAGPVVSDDDEDEGDDPDEEAAIRELMEMQNAEGEEEEEEGMVEGDEEESESDMDEEEEEEEEAPANNAWANGEGPDGQGTTAVVALVRSGDFPEVFCANAGDSRCVMARGKKALNMSRDHKPTLKSEMSRITKAGGFVTSEGRVDGNLNLSRALGDFAYKKDTSLKPVEQKISPEAELRHQQITPADRYLLIGCDGIFEKATSQALIDFMLPRLGRTVAARGRQAGSTALSEVCSAFLDHNIAKVPPKEQGLGCDNMTLMAVRLSSSTEELDDSVLPKVAGPKSRRAASADTGARVGVRRNIGKANAMSRRRQILRAHRHRAGLLGALAEAKKRAKQQG